MVDTIWGATQKPIASEQLANFFAAHSEMEGTLYIGYPVIGTPDGAYPIDALLLSPGYGLVVFNVIEGKCLENYKDEQDESYTKLQAKLLQHKGLVQSRNLKVPIQVVTFAPVVAKIENYWEDSEHPVCNQKTLRNYFDKLRGADIEVEKNTTILPLTL